MSPSSPGGTRPPFRSSRALQAQRDQSPRSETIAFVLRSMPLIVAAVSVIAASNYLAYLIGRKQVSYEELRRQVDRIVELVDQKRVDELATAAPKQQQDKLEQNGSALTDLTTSTINGKTTVAPEPVTVGKSFSAAVSNDISPTTLPRTVVVLPPAPPLTGATKHREMHAVARPRVVRKQKASGSNPADSASAAWARQTTTAAPAAPDVSLAGQ
jgi:hypothetical protein